MRNIAVPHHGSSILSGPEYVQTIQDKLGLKWEMSERLRENLTLQNQELKNLNYNFAKNIIGVKIFSYVETRDTQLDVLSSSDGSGESLTLLSLCVVDSRSAILNSADVPVDEEEVVYLSTTHAGSPHFEGAGASCAAFVLKITSFIRSFDAEERAAYHRLTSSIMNDIHVDVHQFYEKRDPKTGSSIKVWSEYPSLQDFFDLGPRECLKARLSETDRRKQEMPNGNVRPNLKISPATEPIAPTITVTMTPSDELTDSEKPLRRKSSQSTDQLLPDDTGFRTLTPYGQPVEYFRTRPPSLPPDPGTVMTGYLTPSELKPVSQASTDYDDSSRADRLHRAPTYQLPSISTDRFRWVHVPFTHAGWVPVSSEEIFVLVKRKDNVNGVSSKSWQQFLKKRAILTSTVIFCLINCGFPNTIQQPGIRHLMHASSDRRSSASYQEVGHPPHAARIDHRSANRSLSIDHLRRHSDGIKTPAGASRDVQLVLYVRIPPSEVDLLC